MHERSPHLMPSDSLAFRIGGNAGIWYLRFALDPMKRRCARHFTRSDEARHQPPPPHRIAGPCMHPCMTFS